MTIKEAMAASELKLLQEFPTLNSNMLFHLDHAWPLIPRDPADKNYQAFWNAIHGVGEIELGMECDWLIQQPNPARAARIICVAWLAAEGRVEAV